MPATKGTNPPSRFPHGQVIAISLLVLVLALYGGWRLFLYSVFSPHTSRAERGVAAFQACLDKGGPLPATTPDGSGEIWTEQGLTFFDLGDAGGLGFYYEVLCKSPQPLTPGTHTRRGVVVSCKPIATGFYWLVVKN